MYYSAPFRKFCPIFVFRVRDPGFELYLYGTRAHFSLKNAKGWPPLSSLLFFFLSLSLSLSNCMALFVITACVMRAGQNGIADKSQRTNRRDQPDKVWLDIRAYESNNLILSLFSRGSRDWRGSSSSAVSLVQFTPGYKISVGTAASGRARRPTRS